MPVDGNDGLAYLFTVSESPTTTRERFGRVMATIIGHQSTPRAHDGRIAAVAKRGGVSGKPLTIQSALLTQKSNFAFGIAPNQADDHNLLFATLKPIHGPELDAREGVFERGQESELSQGISSMPT